MIFNIKHYIQEEMSSSRVSIKRHVLTLMPVQTKFGVYKYFLTLSADSDYTVCPRRQNSTRVKLHDFVFYYSQHTLYMFTLYSLRIFLATVLLLDILLSEQTCGELYALKTP